MIHTW